MKESDKTYEIDMCNGPLLGKIILFYVPLMLSGILQLLFNAADVAVVGRFAGNEALAAVGSTSSLTNLLVNLFIGLSVGANVLVSRFYGAEQFQELKEMIQTILNAAIHYLMTNLQMISLIIYYLIRLLVENGKMIKTPWKKKQNWGLLGVLVLDYRLLVMGKCSFCKQQSTK